MMKNSRIWICIWIWMFLSLMVVPFQKGGRKRTTHIHAFSTFTGTTRIRTTGRSNTSTPKAEVEATRTTTTTTTKTTARPSSPAFIYRYRRTFSSLSLSAAHTSSLPITTTSSSKDDTVNTKNTKNTTKETKKTMNKKDMWFPTRIQEDVPYRDIVQALFLRHIVVETPETAQLLYDRYNNNNNNYNDSGTHDDLQKDPQASQQEQQRQRQREEESYFLDDPFGNLVTMSVCEESKAQQGRVGWIDLEQKHNNNQHSFHYHPLIPNDIWETLITYAPKLGDVHVITSSITQQTHIVKVEEWMVQPKIMTMMKKMKTTTEKQSFDKEENDDNNDEFRIGSHSGVNIIQSSSSQKRRRFKGQGNFAAPMKTRPKTYHIQTMGCQMNVADSERLQGILEGETLQLKRVGHSPVSYVGSGGDNYSSSSSTIVTTTNGTMTKKTPSELQKEALQADVVIFNTCSIRDKAEQKLYTALGPYRARKRAGESLALLVTGCVAQQEGEALLQKIPELDVVLGPQYVPFLGNILEQVEWGHQLVMTAPMLHQEDNIVNAYEGPSSTTNTTTTSSTVNNYQNNPVSKPIRGHSVKAYVNTILGCNEHCTYCVVPATRGMEQSRSMEAIWEECRSLIVDDGYSEITLLGQNIDAYGRDMVPKRSFAQLLEYLNSNILALQSSRSSQASSLSLSAGIHRQSNVRIRYTTSHPRYMSHKAIDAIANLEAVCEGFHVPFQAGDNTVLKRMRRGYTFESYCKIIDRIRDQSPDAGIYADVICGFPGETEEQFQRTLELMEYVKFDNLNAFCYSTRPNTEAALWEDQVPEDIKKDRLRRVQDLATRHGLERSERYVGRIEEILVEDANPRNHHQVMGRTRQGRQVYFDGDLEDLQGTFVNVKITEARTWSLIGELVY